MTYPEALRARKEGLLADLLRQADAREPLTAGLRLRFPSTADTLALIAQAVEAERRCCRFLRFETVVEPDGGPFFVPLTGPPGARQFVEALMDDQNPSTRDR